jgi:membrane fusion protein (multidrug efflux system)
VQKIISDNQKAPEKNNSKKESILNVNAIKVKYEILDNKIITSGTFLADESIALKSEISGKIDEINFYEGKPVNSKQLLIKLKSDDILAQIKKTKERLNFLELTEKRQKKLLAIEGISQEEYDITLSELSIQKAELEYFNSLLEKTKIYSPFAGTAGLRYFSVGSYITPNDVISNIYKIDRLKLEFSIPQKYFNLLEVGKSIEFTLPPMPDIHNATIYAVDPEINATTRTVIARAYYNNAVKKIKPGSFAEIMLNTSFQDKKIMIPTQALIPDLESEKVYIFKDGKAVFQNVKTGLRTTTEIEIVEGLNEGDIVISSGIMQLRPNTFVKIILKGE